MQQRQQRRGREIVVGALVCGALAFGMQAGCGEEDPPPSISVAVDSQSEALVRETLGFVPAVDFVIEVASDPAQRAAAPGAMRLAVVIDPGCTECYVLERAPHGVVVRGGYPLGLQYGVAHALELYEFRFFTPSYTVAPRQLRLPDSMLPVFGKQHRPEIARRGLHLHTIHPTEAYFAVWEPSESNLGEAKRIVDWAIKNRANYMQWVALDNVQAVGADPTAWQAHTRAIVDYLHERGATAGLAIQLFGQSNLQQGFDLVDEEDPMVDVEPEMRRRLRTVFDVIDFDNINLSFGEFFGADPAHFVATVNQAFAVIQSLSPATEMSATIHVGDDADLRVDYMGESLIYYFLVKFANAAIVPWVHSVMFYNLFDDAGGAYHHERFDEHLAYLLERLAAGARVGYFPETAYWIAFDNSVPYYAPVYIRSRWRDLAELREVAVTPLEDHVLFSSGWEWGYWQNDYTALRVSFELPADYRETIDEMFAPFGADGAVASDAVYELAELEHTVLIEGRLAKYMAGRDFYIDVGDQVNIVSQPDRPEPVEVAAYTEAEKATFTRDVLDELARFATEVDKMHAGLVARKVPRSVRWYAELVDGMEVTAIRARYSEAIYRAVVEPGDISAAKASVDRLFDAARVVVDRRHVDMHDPFPDRLLYGVTNATFYQWGYLKQTHELCFWDRERVKLANFLDGASAPIPTCVF